jgi:hypothetical protein
VQADEAASVLASTLKGVTAVWILITTDYLVPGDDNAAAAMS